jgi:hypothetical protein
VAPVRSGIAVALATRKAQSAERCLRVPGTSRCRTRKTEQRGKAFGEERNERGKAMGEQKTNKQLGNRERGERNEQLGRGEKTERLGDRDRSERLGRGERNERLGTTRERTERFGRGETNERLGTSRTDRSGFAREGRESRQLSSEQRDRIKNVFTEHRDRFTKFRTSRVDFDVHPGVRIPRGFHLFSLPSDIVSSHGIADIGSSIMRMSS